MKIAIIAPSAVPFTIGGAEKFWWGLQQAINQYTRHEAELIKLPSRESNFVELMDSYRRFSELDLSYFDRVISSKYPAWMVAHPEHYCYLQHRLRGLYDTYPLTGLPLEIQALEPQLQPLMELLNKPCPGRADLLRFWQQWQRVRQLLDQGELSHQSLAFPGPLSRKIIHYLDNIALSTTAIKKFSTISHNVAGRADYFPANVPVQVIHHPSDITQFKTSPSQTEANKRPYIFTISRLDQPKRIHLLIEAFLLTDADVEFRIAGTGPDAERLQQLVSKDPRIRFLGRITDNEVVEQYSGALFVPFIPYDEDYGLITIEAMQSAKAVLTTTDAGGVNEFVEHGVSGYSVAPEPKALAEAMRRLLANPEQTRQMGRNALHKVVHINWENTVKLLLDESAPQVSVSGEIVSETENRLISPVQNKSDSGRKNIVVVLTFSVWPPRGGGQSRVYNLYREVAREHNITLVALVEPDKMQKKANEKADIQHQELLIAPNMREIRVAKSQQQLDEEQQLQKQLQVPVSDIACIDGYKLTPHFKKVLAGTCQNADRVIACHPFLFKAIMEVWQGPLWYEAQDVEVDMKRVILKAQQESQPWLDKVRQIEEQCCQRSDRILTCSDKDTLQLIELYRLPPDKMLTVPNGVDMRRASAERSIRPAQHQRLIVLFMGSWHGPNIEAMEYLIAIAGQCQDADFLVLGSVCQHPVCQTLPTNMRSLGVVSEEEKNICLHYADLAVNPILSGSGTNLKMLDYTASFLPVLTTHFGLRGLDFITEKELLCAEIEQFTEIINRFAGQWANKNERKKVQTLLSNMARLAYKRTEKEYIWAVIANKILQNLS